MSQENKELRAFSEWLDANRSADVSSIFHEIVAKVRDLKEQAAQGDAVRDSALEAVKQLSIGYEGGFFSSKGDDLAGEFTLHYESPQEAEAAFEAITSAIDAALRSHQEGE